MSDLEVIRAGATGKVLQISATEERPTLEQMANSGLNGYQVKTNGASPYLVEWSASVNGSFAPINPANPTTVQLTATHIVAATTTPSAYVYRVKSVDSGGIASPNFSNIDYAVAGSRLFASVNAQDEPLRKGLSPVRAMDIVELRRCIDALRSAAGIPQLWAGAPAPSGPITADDFLSLQAPLNAASLRHADDVLPRLLRLPAHDARRVPRKVDKMIVDALPCARYRGRHSVGM
jgi:hypothetical protein